MCTVLVCSNSFVIRRVVSHAFSIGRRALSVQRRGSKSTFACAGMLSCLVLLLGTEPRAHAGPLTYQFQAEVASVLPDAGGVSLPVQISVGDIITGTFTFDPSLGGQPFEQPGLLAFLIHGQVFAIQGYKMEVANNNFPNAVPLEYTIADPARILDDVAPGSSDSIVLRSASLDGFSAVLDSDPDLLLDPRVFFANDDLLLTSSDLVTDLSIWNTFSFREMSLSFMNETTGGSVYIGALIGPVTAIPEPAMAFGVLGGCILISRLVRNTRRRGIVM